MIKLELKNIKEIDEDNRELVKKICEEKFEYFNDLFKRYGKNLKLEVIFKKTTKVFTATASLNLKSKKMLLVEEGKDAELVVIGLFSKFKKAVKKQYELERKD